MNANSPRLPFLVWNPEGHQPRFEHWSQEDALKEAKRLALLAPGKRFYVLRPIALATIKDPVEVTTFDNDDDIPF